MKYIILAVILFAIFAFPASATYYAEGIHSSTLDGTDDGSAGPLNIGFTFPFYETNQTQFYATTNGIVSFGGGGSAYSNTVLPSSSYTYPAVFPFWDDLNPYENGSILYAAIAEGESGNPYGTDVLVVQWTNYRFHGTVLGVDSFQVHLVSDGNITFNYNSLIEPTRSYGQSATIGIQENNTGSFIQHSYNMDAGIRSGYAIIFAYDDGINYTKSEAGIEVFWDILLYKAGTVQPPTKPYSPSPSVGVTTSTSPTLSWSSENATNYTVKVSTNNDLSGASSYLTTESSVSFSGLSADTTYYWHVIARNDGGETHSDVWNFITGSVPVVNFTSNVTSGALPLAVNFTDLSTNAPNSWAWDFGDGNNSTDQNPIHVYASVGTYNVTLNATNTDGNGTIAKSSYITVAIAPVAVFSSNVTSGAVPHSVNFIDVSANGPTSWFWDFGDGNNSTDQNPIHIYTSVGSYNVSLNATNVAGSNVSTQTNYILAAIAPVANFTASATSGTAPFAVTFTDLSTNSPAVWAWDFGDGATSTDKIPTHTYTSAGTYTVSLNASNVGGSNVSTHAGYITVSSASSGSGTRASVSPGQPPESVTSTHTAVTNVMGGTSIQYDLSGTGSPVLGISFDAKDNEGRVVAKVQVLSDRAEGIPAPAGNSYQLMSIDVGSQGTISSHNADNILIRFKVSREWISENNIDPATIRMTRYYDSQWNDLPTYQERGEGEYIYFYAETPGFSIFSVVGDKVKGVSQEVQPASQDLADENPEEPVNEEDKSTPGFTGLIGMLFVSVAFVVSRRFREQ
ncbi:MAG: PKD domain-containing protein [Methanolobus sp.]|nr:PKD domain-containing protein [Methanolobus sp.]